MMRKLSLFIATSVDGFIAKPNDNLDFLKRVAKEGEDYGHAAFMSQVDTLILGRKTYDYVVREIGPTYYDNGERDVYVITRTERPPQGRTVFYTGELKGLVERLKSEPGQTIYCDGGAEVINELLRHDLVDEMTISMVPTLVGEGVRLFQDGGSEHTLELVHAKSYDTGLVQFQYRRLRP